MEIEISTPRDVLGGIPQNITPNGPQKTTQDKSQDVPPDIPTINEFASYANDDPSDTLLFYEAEGRLLSLWDQLIELKLEISLLEAQSNSPSPLPPPPHSEDEAPNPHSEETLTAALKTAEKECLEARAAYTLKQSAIEDVLVTAPILKAVHSGSKATATERTLRPLINRRDVLSIASTNLTTALQQIRVHTTRTDREHTAAVEKNRELAPTVITIAREVKAMREDAVERSGLRGELEEAREEAREEKRKWRIMKSVVGAVVVGSGVDWAGEGRLRELVLDDETVDGFD